VLAKPSALLLTARDLAVFRWLWMLRVMTIGQIRRLAFYQPDTHTLSNFDNVRKRLKRLCDADFITADLLIDTKERLYTLAREGLRMLNRQMGIDQQRVYEPRYDSLVHLHHPLLITECAVRIVESLRGTDIELLSLAPLSIEFYHAHAVGDSTKRKHIERFVTQEDLRIAGHPEPFRIRPDLVFALGKDQHHRLFFLEADRGHESRSVIRDKQVGYHHYARYPDPDNPKRYLWQRYGDVADFRVLFVTTSPRRIQALEKVLKTQPGFSLMAFTTEAELKAGHFFYDPIWRVDGEPPRSLLKPENESLPIRRRANDNTR
jgi:hypothetical protein